MLSFAIRLDIILFGKALMVPVTHNNVQKHPERLPEDFNGFKDFTLCSKTVFRPGTRLL